MKQMFAALAITLAVAPGVAPAQTVGDCDWLGSAANIVEPWESYSRSFANGDVRLALLDAIEPGAVPFHLLLLAPSGEEMGGRMCKVISLEPGIGFHAIHWTDLDARYDPAKGLIFHTPVEIWIDTGNIIVRGLQVTLNQATGTVEAVILDGTEGME